MPHLPEKFGTYPLVLRDFRVENLKLGEILMDYDKYELYYVKRDTGELVSVARDIFNYILALRTQNSFFEIIDADLQDPPMINTEDEYPPIKERKYNHFYYIIRRRVSQVVDDSI